ncbi:MAG: hypothetical protein HQM09_01775 [Candidatus Riflebacteria bacterium]|nr:hypothetical protein [Candidatus Riflebacteria bacterium]
MKFLSEPLIRIDFKCAILILIGLIGTSFLQTANAADNNVGNISEITTKSGVFAIHGVVAPTKIVNTFLSRNHGFPQSWTAKFHDASGSGVIETKLSPEGKFIFSSIPGGQTGWIEISAPDGTGPKLLALQGIRNQDSADLVVDETTTAEAMLVQHLQRITGRQISSAELGSSKFLAARNIAVTQFRSACASETIFTDDTVIKLADGMAQDLSMSSATSAILHDNKINDSTGTSLAITATGLSTSNTVTDSSSVISSSTTAFPEKESNAGMPQTESSEKKSGGESTPVQAAPSGVAAETPKNSTASITTTPPESRIFTLDPPVVDQNSLALQFRFMNVPGDYENDISLMDDKGGTVLFRRSNSLCELGRIVIAYNGIEIHSMRPITELKFTLPVPSGATIELYNVDKDVVLRTLSIP